MIKSERSSVMACQRDESGVTEGSSILACQSNDWSRRERCNRLVKDDVVMVDVNLIVSKCESLKFNSGGWAFSNSSDRFAQP